jgi:hypothetical protein
MNDFSVLIQAISVVIASLSVAFAANAWRREFLGKRRIELAEDVLTLFYRARHEIRQIRSTMVEKKEGATRERQENESPEMSQALDKVHIYMERIEARNEIFDKLRSLRYRCMARYGREVEKPFDDLNQILCEILHSAHMLYGVYLNREKCSPSTHRKQIAKHEAIIWCLETVRSGPDDVSKKVDKIVEEAESHFGAAIKNASEGGLDSLERLLKEI